MYLLHFRYVLCKCIYYTMSHNGSVKRFWWSSNGLVYYAAPSLPTRHTSHVNEHGQCSGYAALAPSAIALLLITCLYDIHNLLLSVVALAPSVAAPSLLASGTRNTRFCGHRGKIYAAPLVSRASGVPVACMGILAVAAPIASWWNAHNLLHRLLLLTCSIDMPLERVTMRLWRSRKRTSNHAAPSW